MIGQWMIILRNYFLMKADVYLMNQESFKTGTSRSIKLSFNHNSDCRRCKQVK